MNAGSSALPFTIDRPFVGWRMLCAVLAMTAFWPSVLLPIMLHSDASLRWIAFSVPASACVASAFAAAWGLLARATLSEGGVRFGVSRWTWDEVRAARWTADGVLELTVRERRPAWGTDGWGLVEVSVPGDQRDDVDAIVAARLPNSVP